MATIVVLVCCNMDEITAVPRDPHPIIPIRTAEFACEPKTIRGLKIVNAESAAACFKNVLRSILVILLFVYTKRFLLLAFLVT
jgi:hypothetical protein